MRHENYRCHSPKVSMKPKILVSGGTTIPSSSLSLHSSFQGKSLVHRWENLFLMSLTVIGAICFPGFLLLLATCAKCSLGVLVQS